MASITPSPSNMTYAQALTDARSLIVQQSTRIKADAQKIKRYAAATGRDAETLSGGLAYYRAFNYFKTAGILIGVYARYVAGQKSTEGVDLPMLLSRVTASVDMAWDAGAGLRR